MALNEKTAVDISEHQEAVDEAVHVPKDLASEAAAAGQGLTGYEGLSVWGTIKAFKMNALICSLIAVSAATDGYQIGLIGNLVANPGFTQKFGTKLNADGEVVFASSILSLWGVMGSLGQIIGMVSLPFLSDRFGRKAAMYCYWAILALSVMVECVSPDWKVWTLSKLLGGIGVGCMQSTIPIYIAEVAPIRARGVFLMGYSLWWIIGQFFAPVALQVLSTTDAYNYLTPIYSQWGHIGLMLIIYLWIPESPAWCATRDKAELAKKSLRAIYRGVKDFDVEHAYKLLIINIEHERAVACEQRNEKWYAIFRGIDGKRTLVACWTLLTQQFIGLGVFFSFGSYFFQQAGIKDPFRVTCITSGIDIAVSIALLFLADYVGRRRLACYGTTLCAVCNIAVGILGVTPRTGASDDLLVLFACLWHVGLITNAAAGWGFIGEISSQRLRQYTSGFAAASTCVVGIVMGFLIPYMINDSEWNWGLKTCWFFAGIGLPFTIAMWFLIPETSGRSAAELDELFERKIKPYRFHKTITATQRVAEAEHIIKL